MSTEPQPNSPTWKRVFRRTIGAFADDELNFSAATISFYTFMSFVPLLAIIVGLYGLFADPAGVTELASSFQGLVPPTVEQFIGEQLHAVAAEKVTAGWSALIAVIVAFGLALLRSIR